MKPDRNTRTCSTHSRRTYVSLMSMHMQLLKCVALARSCPVSIGWIPKQSDILRSALWTSISSSSQGRNISVHQSGLTFKLTPDESNSLSQVAQEFQSTLVVEPREEQCSTAGKCNSSGLPTPVNLRLQVEHIKILMFSPSQPSVLSAQGTLLGLETHLASCQEHNTVTASADSLLITDKRALAASYHALVSMLPDSGKCLQVSYSANTQLRTAVHGARSASVKQQSAHLF